MRFKILRKGYRYSGSCIAAILVAAWLAFLSFEGLAPAEKSLPPAEESSAYRRFVRGPRSELAKLLYLMERFSNTDFAVIYNGTTHDMHKAVHYARSYLAKHYRQEKVESWLMLHSYRSEPDGKIIYLKYPGGERRPLMHVLLEELKVLDQILHSS